MIRKLRFDARVHGYNRSGVIDALMEVPQNMFNLVRNETMSEFAENVRKYATKNIEKSNKNSSSQLTGRLADSIRTVYNPNENRLTISVGEGVDYAEIADKPEGTSTPIAPKNYYDKNGNGPYLVFWIERDRNGKGPHLVKTKKTVNRPGTAFFTKAWSRAQKEIPQSIQKWSDYFNEKYYEGDNVLRISDSGALIYRGGGRTRNELRAKGLVDERGRFTAKARRNARLSGKI